MDFDSSLPKVLEVDLNPFKKPLFFFKQMVNQKLFSSYTEILDYAYQFKNKHDEINSLISESSKNDDKIISFNGKFKWLIFSKLDNMIISHFNLFNKTVNRDLDVILSKLKQIINDTINSLLNYTTNFFDLTVWERKNKVAFIESKIENIIYFFRRFIIFDEHIEIINFTINILGKTKYFIYPNELIAQHIL